MICLGIESTAHTFGIGVVDEKGKILANVKKTYTTDSGGIIPAKAADHHIELCDSILDDINKSFCGVRLGVLYPTASPTKNDRSVVYSERDTVVNHFWNYIDHKSPFLFQCNGTVDDLNDWIQYVLKALQSTESFIQLNYGFVTSHKFSSTSLIFNAKTKKLKLKDL